MAKLRRKCACCEKVKAVAYRWYNDYYCSEACVFKASSGVEYSTCSHCGKPLLDDEKRKIYTKHSYCANFDVYCSIECYFAGRGIEKVDGAGKETDK